MMLTDFVFFPFADYTKGLGCKLEPCSPEILIFVLSGKKKSPWLIVIIQTAGKCPWKRQVWSVKLFAEYSLHGGKPKLAVGADNIEGTLVERAQGLASLLGLARWAS